MEVYFNSFFSLFPSVQAAVLHLLQNPTTSWICEHRPRLRWVSAVWGVGSSSSEGTERAGLGSCSSSPGRASRPGLHPGFLQSCLLHHSRLMHFLFPSKEGKTSPDTLGSEKTWHLLWLIPWPHWPIVTNERGEAASLISERQNAVSISRGRRAAAPIAPLAADEQHKTRSWSIGEAPLLWEDT